MSLQSMPDLDIVGPRANWGPKNMGHTWPDKFLIDALNWLRPLDFSALKFMPASSAACTRHHYLLDAILFFQPGCILSSSIRPPYILLWPTQDTLSFQQLCQHFSLVIYFPHQSSISAFSFPSGVQAPTNSPRALLSVVSPCRSFHVLPGHLCL